MTGVQTCALPILDIAMRKNTRASDSIEPKKIITEQPSLSMLLEHSAIAKFGEKQNVEVTEKNETIEEPAEPETIEAINKRLGLNIEKRVMEPLANPLFPVTSNAGTIDQKTKPVASNVNIVEVKPVVERVKPEPKIRKSSISEKGVIPDQELVGTQKWWNDLSDGWKYIFKLSLLLDGVDSNFDQINEIKLNKVINDLNEVIISRTDVTDLTPLYELTNLKKLLINNPAISELIPVYHLGLELLEIRMSSLSDHEIALFKTNNPDCVIKRV